MKSCPPSWADFFLLISQDTLKECSQNSTQFYNIMWPTFTNSNVLNKRDGHEVING